MTNLPPIATSMQDMSLIANGCDSLGRESLFWTWRSIDGKIHSTAVESGFFPLQAEKEEFAWRNISWPK